MGGCCGGGSAKVVVPAKGTFQGAEVQFVWPDKESADKLEYKEGGLRNATKPFKVVELKEHRDPVVFLPPGTYKSRWWKGGVKYLTPNAVAPTLLRKLLENDKVKDLLQGFEWDAELDPQISMLPDGRVKDALAKLEDLLPVNQFEIKPSVEVMLGKYVENKLELSGGEKMKLEMRKKTRDPRFIIASKRLAKKAAVEAGKAALSQLGISLDAILGDVLGIFGIDVPEGELDAKVADYNVDVFEPLSEDEMKSLEQASYEFKSTAVARFCLATQKTRVPLWVEWNAQAENCRFRWWRFQGEGVAVPADQINEVVLQAKKPRPKPAKEEESEQKELTAEEAEKKKKKEEEEAKKEAEKPLIGKEALVEFPPGRIAFQWIVDDAVYFDFGDVAPAKPADANAAAFFKVMEVKVVDPIIE
jgi:hypothetical protein